MENASTVANFTARPVRISAAELRRPITGTVQVRDPGDRAEIYTGDVRWTLRDLDAPESPAPDGEAPLSRVTDQLGCLEFAQAPAARICFRVMGDVGSVGLNPRELQSAQFGDLWPAGPAADANAALVSAARDGHDYVMQFASGGQRIDVRLQVSR